MSLITSLTRAYLTRSFKPFTFTSDFDKTLDFENCQSLGLYVHIPFCKSICNFCPYCKQLFNESDCNRYIDALLKEIDLVSKNQKEKKRVTSLYFGGGTPALAADRIGEIIARIKEHFIITEGIGIELHPENVNVETLQKLKTAGVTKLSIGIQSFLPKYQEILVRSKANEEKLKSALSQVHFETVSMDFIFALPSQTFADLKFDVDKAFSIGANHLAIYPFIDFTFTNSKIKPMAKNEKRKLLDDITDYFEKIGCNRSSIWTFTTEKTTSYSSMTRDNFLGFGCSATTLLKDSFKINTFSVEEYIKRVDNKTLPTALTCRFSERQRMIYYLFWTAYSTKVSEEDFECFFGKSLKKIYGFEIYLAKLLGFVTQKDGTYKMTNKGAFYYHYYENFYTLSYIDKMWGIMRKEAFPKGMKF